MTENNLTLPTLPTAHETTHHQRHREQEFTHVEGRKAKESSSCPEIITSFETPCPMCQHPTKSNMCKHNIPHFKEIIIMTFLCDECGYKSNDIQTSGSNGSGCDGEANNINYATKLTLHVRNEDDLLRDVVKSDTAGISIPEIELSLDEGGLGGVYTTVEGLLSKMYHQLKEANPYIEKNSDGGDKDDQTQSANHTSVAIRFMKCLESLDEMRKAKRFPFRLIINDPMSNSFISPTPSASKPCLKDGHDNDFILTKSHENSSNESSMMPSNGVKCTRAKRFDKYLEKFRYELNYE